jgi:hypothetical protein
MSMGKREDKQQPLWVGAQESYRDPQGIASTRS